MSHPDNTPRIRRKKYQTTWSSAESTKFKITVVVLDIYWNSNMSRHGYRPISHMAPLPSHQNLNFKSAIPPCMSHYLRRKNIRQRGSPAESTKFKITVAVFPGISRISLHGYMSHMTPSPLVRDLEVLTIYGIKNQSKPVQSGLNRFYESYISWRRWCMSHEMRRKKLSDSAIAPLSQQNSK